MSKAKLTGSSSPKTDRTADRLPVAAPLSRLEWYLRGQIDESGCVWRTNLRPLPFSVGRVAGVNLQLSSKRVSQRHAELFERNSTLLIRDLDSTNGTFVNGESVSERELREGDILHFADQQFRLEVERPAPPGVHPRPLSGTDLAVAPRAVQHVKDLVDLLRAQAVLIEFQPMVRMADRQVVAYEALGRGAVAGIPSTPAELFAVAEGLGLAAELSAVLRRRQLDEGRRVIHASGDAQRELFLNTHPSEIGNWETILRALETFRAGEPELTVVLEIHESAVADIANFRALRQQLKAVDVQLAFDDFGTGQGRLEELCEVAPDYVKFDISFARDLHLASPKRREMVRSLVRMMMDLQIYTVLEGIETAEEASACAELGFHYAQGFYFGRPAPLEAYV